MPLGPELITNGNFTTNLNGWAVDNLGYDGTVTWDNGKALASGGTGAGVFFNQTGLSLDSTTRYLVSCNLVVYTPGISYGFGIQFRSNSENEIIGIGEFVNDSGSINSLANFYLDDLGSIVIDEIQLIFFPGFTGTVDNVSVKEILPRVTTTVFSTDY